MSGRLAGVVALGAIAGCGLSDDDAPRRSEGCMGAAPAAGERTIDVGGEARRYLLGLPSDYDADVAYPLLFGFHGARSSAEEFASPFYGNLPAVAGDDAILVHGQALVVDDFVQWTHATDVAYFDGVLDEVANAACVDMNRVFATGHSSGGAFTNRLGCERGGVLRAIAPLAGAGPAFGPMDPGCVGQVAAWIEHSSDDMVVDITLGERSRDYWGAANGCDLGSPVTTTPAGCVAYPGCDPGFPVHWCVSSGGHEPQPELTAAGAWNFFDAL